jgi:hypothetical protein
MPNAFEMLGFHDMAFVARTARTLPYEVHHPRTFDDVCDQADAIEMLRQWDGARPLLLVGGHGWGKSTLAALVCVHRGAKLVDPLELRSIARAREYVRMHRSGPCVIHAVAHVVTLAEIESLLAQRVPLIIECTPKDALNDLRELVRRCEVCTLNQPSAHAMRAWLAQRGLAAACAHVVPGDLRATMLDAHTAAPAAARASLMDDETSAANLVGVDYAPELDVDRLAELAELISATALFREGEMVQCVVSLLERRPDTCVRACADRGWSTVGVTAAKRTILRTHASAQLPTTTQGFRNAIERIWYAPRGRVDKRGVQIIDSHAMLKKRRRGKAATVAAAT